MRLDATATGQSCSGRHTSTPGSGGSAREVQNNEPADFEHFITGPPDALVSEYRMPSQLSALSRILQSPGRILLVMLLVVFAVEVAVMLTLPFLVPSVLGETSRAVLDALLLTLISAPALWWVIVSPLRRIAVQEQARSETIVSNAAEGIVTVTEAGIVASANRAALGLFGLSPEELLGRQISDVVPELKIRATQPGTPNVTTGLRSDRQSFPLSVSISEFPSERGTGFIAILQDLTEANRIEQEKLIAAREREALRAQQMATLAQLATGVAHEIRNPLTSIKMLIQVNRAKFAEEGLPTRDMELVEQEIRRMERSVTALLDYGRPARSEFRLFSLQEAVQKALRLMEGRCREGGVELIADVPEVPVRVYGDASEIQQLLLNLGLNALDVMPDGGQLTIQLIRRGEQAVLSVSDTGTGIPDEVICRLFTPFVTTKANGVGLGLGICRRIAESHRGRLNGFNLPTGGACFELLLPIAHDDQSHEFAASKSTDSPDGKED
ncbi:MAG: PAS domain S-box protein [Planctomycetaceae bacterium]|nr:PAS domain S-box protein [Planctomycetaceae bacterium]